MDCLKGDQVMEKTQSALPLNVAVTAITFLTLITYGTCIDNNNNRGGFKGASARSSKIVYLAICYCYYIQHEDFIQ